jgi:catechol 2,3-dioxygenase-like lactoylglutathione lyase family enzyme
MKFEHVAFNVPDARAQARWLVDQLGFTVYRASETAPYMNFLADETGRVVLELYSNTAAPIPDYKNQPPLVLHFAMATKDAGADGERLRQAGGTVFSDTTQPDGTRFVMVRDPWGLALQFCQRASPFPMP